MEQRVSISIADGIADVRLVRADKMNALDAAMFDALVAATARLAQEKGVRAVVLSGEGRAFCAGLDMGRFAAMKESGGNGIAGGERRDLSARTHGLANYPQQAVWGWRQQPRDWQAADTTHWWIRLHWQCSRRSEPLVRSRAQAHSIGASFGR